jgi:hypothetical protein
VSLETHSTASRVCQLCQLCQSCQSCPVGSISQAARAPTATFLLHGTTFRLAEIANKPRGMPRLCHGIRRFRALWRSSKVGRAGKVLMSSCAANSTGQRLCTPETRSHHHVHRLLNSPSSGEPTVRYLFCIQSMCRHVQLCPNGDCDTSNFCTGFPTSRSPADCLCAPLCSCGPIAVLIGRHNGLRSQYSLQR